jgi:hypothetical protein
MRSVIRKSLPKLNGVPQPFGWRKTILEVNLTRPIAPNATVHFEMEFDTGALQIRRVAVII